MTEKTIGIKKNSLISWLIFLPTFLIVSFTLFLGMFPAMIIAFSDKIRFPIEINIWEPGIWMLPILVTNVIVFTTIIFYRKNKLPDRLTSLFNFILNFEVSKRMSIIIVAILIGTYVIFTVGELSQEEPWEDGKNIKEYFQNLTFDDLTFHGKMIPYVFGYFSMDLFGSLRIAPFFASILCLFLIYLLTVQISKKRFAGIVAVALVIQSGNFLIYDTTFTYPIFWIMFYLFSLYFIFKSWPLSSTAFIPAIFSHPLTVGFLPITIPFIALLELPKRKKILLLSFYLAIIFIGVILIYSQILSFDYDFSSSLVSTFDPSKILDAFAITLSQFRYDSVIVLFLLPLVVCLFLKSKQGFPNANAVLVLIGGIILLIALVPVLTTMGNTPYRILPLVFFFAIGVGTLLSKNINLQDESLSNKL